jgi:ribonuclease HI
MVNCLQINIGKRDAAADELNLRVSNHEAEIIFLQEPKTNKNNKVRGPYGGVSFHSSIHLEKAIRAAIWVKNEVVKSSNCILLEQFSNRDQTAVLLKIKEPQGALRNLVLCSIYLPSLDDKNLPIDNPVSSLLESLVIHCKTSQTELIISGDFNAHNKIWGDKKDDKRGNKIIDFFLTYNLELKNIGNIPTFEVNDKNSVIDLTVSSSNISRIISKWKVDKNESFSDHKIISFCIGSEKFDPITSKIKKKTDWTKYKKLLEERLANFQIRSSTPLEFDESAQNFANILMNAHTECCKTKTIRGKFYTDWFSPYLKTLRNRIRKLYKKAKLHATANKQYSDTLFLKYKELKNDYNSRCMKAKNQSWRSKMSELDNTKETARLLKILENGSAGQIGTLVKTDGSFTSSQEESTDLLMRTHFPDCLVVDPSDQHQNSFNPSEDSNPEEIEDTISIEKISWAIQSLSPFKSPGEDGIFPALLQKAENIVVPIMQEFFRLSLKLGYIPKTWRGTIVKFIPKAAKPRYDSPKAFRPISLMSFILKVLEKLIDYRIRNKFLNNFPLHKYQHAYQPGKGTESALHSLVTEVENFVFNKGMSLAVFIDIEGAFDNTSFETITKAAKDRGVDTCTLNWINAMLQNRLIRTSDEDQISYKPIRGVAQGGCLSPLLWCLVVDSLICQLEKKGFFVSAYADDLAIIISGKIKFNKELCRQMNKDAMKILEKWCVATGLNVNPEKSTVLNFSNSKTRTLPIDIKLFGKSIEQKDNFKYLGIHLDGKLLWNGHIDKAISKGRRTLWAVKSMVAKTWGLNPKRMLWIYQQIILPRITYGCVVWWHKAQQDNNKNKFNSLQRSALLMTTGAMRTTPSIALEALLNVVPLNIKIQMTAFSAFLRLKKSSTWRQDCLISPHKKIAYMLENSDINGDECTRSWCFKRDYKIIINERNNWDEGLNLIFDQNCWYTDGSVRDKKAAIGVHNTVKDVSILKRVSDHSTVMQAELKAIEECAEYCLTENTTNNLITIVSDSRSALFALNKAFADSKTVKECSSKLNNLAVNNDVRIIWCPGHRGISGNEEADRLANLAIANEFVEINVSVGEQKINNKLNEWGHKAALKAWANQKGTLKHSKICITPFENNKASFLMNNTRANIRAIIGLQTGHACTKLYLKRIGKETSEQCRFCKEQSSCETILHLLQNCPKLQSFRLTLFGDGTPSETYLKTLSYKQILKFSKTSGISDALIKYSS